MKRMHMHIGVTDLDRAIAFYSALFGAEPTVRRDDYAKWRLDDPSVNLAVSLNGREGIDHVGLDVDSDEELASVEARLKAAGERVAEDRGAQCCYAESDKSWARDPAGVVWETFHTMGEARIYGEDASRTRLEAIERDGADGQDGSDAPGCCG